MFKRNTIIASILSAFVLTTLCLLASSVTAQAQVEPQQGAINTSRSNIKNTFRTAGSFDPLMLDLKKASGEKIASRKVADSNGNGTLSDSEGTFDFGMLPEGDYVLTIAADADGDTPPDLSRQQGQADAVRAPSNIEVTLDEAVGGRVKHSMKLEADGKESRTFRPGKPTYGNITLRSDGKTKIAGKITLPNGGIVIRNIKKPA